MGTPDSGGEFPLTSLTQLTSLVLTGNTHAHPGLGRPLNSASGFAGARPPAQARIGIGDGVAQLPQLQELHMDGLVDAVPAGEGCFCSWGCWGWINGSWPSCGSERGWRLSCARVGGQGRTCTCRQWTAPATPYSCGVAMCPVPQHRAQWAASSRAQLTPPHCFHPLPLADLWQCSALTHLVIRGTPSADPSYDEDERLLPELPPVDGARLPHLRTLCLRGCAAPPGLLGPLLAAAPQLTALALGDWELWGADGGDGSAELVEELTQLAKLTALQELDLSTLEVRLGGQLSAGAIGTLAQPCICRTELHLSAAMPPAQQCCHPLGGLAWPHQAAAPPGIRSSTVWPQIVQDDWGQLLPALTPLKHLRILR